MDVDIDKIGVAEEPLDPPSQELLDYARDLDLPPEDVGAVEGFGLRHTRLVRSADQLQHRFEALHDIYDRRGNRAFQARVVDVRRNRAVFPEVPADPELRKVEVQKRRRRRKKFALEESVWAPRRAHGNARDWYEGRAAQQRTFDADWTLARYKMSRHLGRCDEETKAALAHALMGAWREIYGAFDYYAVCSTPDSIPGPTDEPDVHNVSMNGYLSWVRDCKLSCEAVPARLIELIFVQANVADEVVREKDKHNKQRLLNRQEWLECIVRIATQRYEKEEPHPAACVERLLSLNLVPRLPAAAKQNSDVFRVRYCYNEQVNACLKRHMATLRALYTRYADMNMVSASDELDDRGLLSIGEWLSLLAHLQLFTPHAQQLTVHEAKLAFVWSRMRSVPDHSSKSVRLYRHLQFEDFLEALVRISAMMALPTDEEVAAAGCANAGQYLSAFAEGAPKEYGEFCHKNKVPWDREPRQKIWRCLDHLLSYITSLVEDNTSRVANDAKDKVVSDAEALEFMNGRRRGTALKRRGEAISAEALLGAQGAVRERLLSALQTVAIFKSLPLPLIGNLVDAMSVSPYADGEYVFDQGDEGDSFYVIISGTAEVIRDEGTADERVLCDLCDGACFGERALLRSEPRFASIRATSKLKTMSITRKAFEERFGPLQQMIDEQYK